MATALTYNDFRYGMISEKLRRRPDLGLYQYSASMIENLVPMRTGGVRLRPGLEEMSDVSNLGIVRVFPFVVSVREHYLILLASGKLYIYGLDIDGKYVNISGNGFITEYTENEISEIQIAHSVNTLILVQRNHPPFVVEKQSAGGWSAGNIVLDTTTDAYNYTYDDEGNETKSPLTYDYEGLFTLNNYPSVVAFCANRLWFGASTEHPYRLWASKPFEYYNFQDMEYYNVLDESMTTTQYMDAIQGSGERLEIIEDAEGNPDMVWEVTKTVDSSTGIVIVVSTVYEYDSSTQGKGEIIGHKEYDPDTDTWGPVIEDGANWKYSYKYTRPVYTLEDIITESSAMILDMASDRDETISWIAYSGSYLMVGTASSEWAMPSSMTALNATSTKFGAYGSKSFMQACYGCNSVFYVQSGGRRLRALSTTSSGLGFSEPTFQCEEILDANAKEIAWQRVQEPRLYCILGDGTMAVLCYDTDYQIQAWCRWTFSGKAKSIAVIDTEDGQEVFLLYSASDETMKLARFTDGVFDDIGENFIGHLITNNLDTLQSLSLTKKSYNVAVDAMGTRFRAGAVGRTLSESFDYSKDLILLSPWTIPTDKGLRYEFESFPGEDMIILAVMIETEAN